MRLLTPSAFQPDTDEHACTFSGVSELSDEALQSRWRFNYLISTFIQSLVSEVLDLEHAAVVLAHFGRFGFEYDEMCKRLAEYMKSAACYGSSAPVASRVVVKSLQDVSGAVSNAILSSADPCAFRFF